MFQAEKLGALLEVFDGTMSPTKQGTIHLSLKTPPLSIYAAVQPKFQSAFLPVCNTLMISSSQQDHINKMSVPNPGDTNMLVFGALKGALSAVWNRYQTKTNHGFFQKYIKDVFFTNVFSSLSLACWMLFVDFLLDYPCKKKQGFTGCSHSFGIYKLLI